MRGGTVVDVQKDVVIFTLFVSCGTLVVVYSSCSVEALSEHQVLLL